MRVLVTGGTGFVGSHSAAGLLAAGYQVRILARSPPNVARTLAALGADADAVEIVQGDVLDRTAVDRALKDMDAVLHAASIYSLDIRRVAEIEHVNVQGTRQLIELAAAKGLDPIVHVSSVVALFRQNVPVQLLSEDAPPGDLPFPYSRSKAEQERIARRLQAQGAPVITTHPGQVLGPYDPYGGEGTQLLRRIVRGELTVCPRGDLAVVDVRDLAKLHVRLFEPGKGPGRFLIARRIPLVDLVRLTLKLAGRSLPVYSVPDEMVRLVGRTAGWLQRQIGTPLPISGEAAWIAIQHLEIDVAGTERLGITCRPVEETITDQLAWQQAAGRL